MTYKKYFVVNEILETEKSYLNYLKELVVVSFMTILSVAGVYIFSKQRSQKCPVIIHFNFFTFVCTYDYNKLFITYKSK